MTTAQNAFSLEQGRLFNPAFLAVVMRAAAQGYDDEDRGLPLPLALLITPIALHQKSRIKRPGTTSAGMRMWVRSNPTSIMGLEERRLGLLPFMLEGINLGIQTGVLLGAPLVIKPGPYRRPAGLPAADSVEICAAAKWFGSWFGKQEMSLADLLALWKVSI